MAALHFATRVFLAGKHFLVTSNGIKSTKEEATKFEKFNRRNPQKKRRKEKEKKIQ